MQKNQLRVHIKQENGRHDEAEYKQVEDMMHQLLLNHKKVNEAGTVIAYWSMTNEVGTHTLVRTLRSMGKRVLLPRVVSPTAMTLHEYEDEESMTRSRYGIMEPEGEPVSIEELRRLGEGALTVIVPGVAFDRSGNRMGHGCGYYDRMLKDLPNAYRLGVCLPWQVVSRVPVDKHDVRMHEVLTVEK